MKRYIIPLLAVVILAGCSTESDIKIINRTDNNLYFTIQHNDYILEGSEDTDTAKIVSVNTGKKFLFYNEGAVEVDLYLEGETFMMQDATIGGQPIGIYFTETTLQVEPDETLKIYCDPTHAGVKLINNSAEVISDLAFYTSETDTLTSLIDAPIAIGDSTWSRLKASSTNEAIIYSFVIEFDDGSIDSSYAEIDNLILDEQLLIELQ